MSGRRQSPGRPALRSLEHPECRTSHPASCLLVAGAATLQDLCRETLPSALFRRDELGSPIKKRWPTRSPSYDPSVDVFSRTASNRRLLADFFDGLTDDQLDTRSLCDAWTVREVLGHLVMPFAGGMGSFLKQVVRARGSVNRASERVAADLARRPVGELTALLRTHADDHVKAPGVGPMGQMTDGCVHLRDCARPLGLPDDVSLDDWRMVLDWLPHGVVGLVPKHRFDGLDLRATDQDWAWGSGEEIAGPSEALAMAMAGRVAAFADLDGKGVLTLRQRMK